MSLSKIQTKLEATKNQYNNFGKYKYRSLEDITDALKPHLKEFNYSLVVSDTIEEIGGRIYVKASAKLYDETMKAIAENSAYAREPLTKKGMDEAQITGATSSYARKYALNGLFAIDDTKDADSQDNSNHVSDVKVSQQDVALIKELLIGTKTNEGTLLENYRVKSIAELTQVNATDAIQRLQKRKG